MLIKNLFLQMFTTRVSKRALVFDGLSQKRPKCLSCLIKTILTVSWFKEEYMVGHLGTPILGMAGLCIKYNVPSHTYTVPFPPQQSPFPASISFYTNTRSNT